MSRAIEVTDPRPISSTGHHVDLRNALSAFPTGVTIVTTTDDTGRWWGFTATSFCSVSMSPPLVLVCLSKSAECHPAFSAADEWAIQVLHQGHSDLATRFATRGADKFARGGFRTSEFGAPVLGEAVATLHCRLHERHDAGDHTILVGDVQRAEHTASAQPAVYCRRDFHRLA